MSGPKQATLATAQGSSPRARAEILPARRVLFERFEVLSERRGPNSTVIEVNDTQENRRLALKMVGPEHTGGDDGARLKRFEMAEREYAVGRTLSHECFTQYHAIIRENERLYVVRGWAEGKSLRELHKEGFRFSEDQIETIASRILDGVSHLHSKRPIIIHRDIKPDNVIVDMHGDVIVGVKLVDLGASPEKRWEDSATTVTTHLYSLGFSAPESIFAPCAQSDLFSVAATVLFLATGNSADDIYDSRVARYNVPGGAGRFKRMVESGLNVAVGERAQTAEEMKAALLGVKAIVAESHESAIAELEQKIAMVRSFPNFEGSSILGTLGGALGFVPICAISRGSIISSLAGAVVGAGVGVGLSCLLQHFSGRKALRELESELEDKRRGLPAAQNESDLLPSVKAQEAERDWSKLDSKDIEVLVPSTKGLNLFETLRIAEEKGYVIAPNEVYERFFSEIRDSGVYPARTGTFVITAGRGKELPVKITYGGMECIVPEQYVGQKIQLEVNHPHFKIEQNRLIVDAEHIHPAVFPEGRVIQTDYAWLGLVARVDDWYDYYRRNVLLGGRPFDAFGVAAINREVYDKLPLRNASE